MCRRWSTGEILIEKQYLKKKNYLKKYKKKNTGKSKKREKKKYMDIIYKDIPQKKEKDSLFVLAIMRTNHLIIRT